MMNDITKWLGRTIIAGAAALVIFSGQAYGQPEAPPAASEAAASEAPAQAEAAPAEAAAAEAPAAPMLNSGDTAWMLTSTALVLLMTIPGVALFYGGMVRKKNVLATMAQSFSVTALITVLWMAIGYSL